MARYAAFIRAINVGGHASVKMSDVRDVFEAAGAGNVATYIQSGNVVFEAAARNVSVIARRAREGLEARIGERTEVFTRSLQRLADLLERSPLAGIEASASAKLYVVFSSGKLRRQIEFPVVSLEERLEVLGIDGFDVFVISRPKKNGFFGFPNAFVEREFGVTATSRNWSTITKLVARFRD